MTYNVWFCPSLVPSPSPPCAFSAFRDAGTAGPGGHMVLLPCSHCTIMKSPLSHAHNNHTGTNLSCSHCTITQPQPSCFHCTTMQSLPSCFQCTTMQSPTSHDPNARSCSHQPPNARSCSHQPPVLPTIMQSPPSSHDPTVEQSGSRHPPMLPTIMRSPTSHVPNNYAITTLPSLGTRPSLAEEEES